MATEPSRVLTKLAALLQEEQGALHFSEEALAKVGAVVEVAARLPDDTHASQALADVIRLGIALGDGGHPAAADGLMKMVRGSPAAVKRLAALRQRDKATFERFERFTQAPSRKVAPSLDQEVSDGVSLKSLLPVGSAGRLERPAATPAAGPAPTSRGRSAPRARGKPPAPESGLPPKPSR